MPSDAYTLIFHALRRREQVTFSYQGLPRECCPVILGYAADGREVLSPISFQARPAARRSCRNGAASMLQVSLISDRDREPGWKARATRRRRAVCISSM